MHFTALTSTKYWQYLQLDAFPFNASELAGAMDHYSAFCDEAVRLAKHAINTIRPSLRRGSEQGQLAVMEPILDVFEKRGSPDRRNRRIELKKAIQPRRVTVTLAGSRQGEVFLPSEDVDLVVRSELSTALISSVGRLRTIFGLGTKSLRTFVREGGGTSEFLNLVCKADRLPRGFVPTGAMNISAASISLFGHSIGILRYRRATILRANGIDPGEYCLRA